MKVKNGVNLGDLWDVKKGDRYTLKCGHSGRIVWVSSDSEMICVRGTDRRCQVCGNKSSGSWFPICYMIPIDDKKK